MNECSVCVLENESGECTGGTSIVQFDPLYITAQTLVPNDLTSTRCQGLYPGYFGSIYVQWEKEDKYYPPLYADTGFTIAHLTAKHALLLLTTNFVTKHSSKSSPTPA